MKIAVDLRSLIGGKISGVENYVLNVVNELAQRELALTGIMNNRKKAGLPRFNPKLQIQQTRIPNKIFNRSLTFFGFPRFESLYGDFDCLWMPDLRPFAISNKTKLALTVHDLSPVMHPEFYSWKRRIWHWEINYKKAYKRADLIFAISEYTKYDLIKLFNLSPEKIKVVYPGIDHAKFNPNLDERIKRKVREKYKLPREYIFTISTLQPRKNFEGLIEAFERINDQGINLVIAGSFGWLHKSLLKRIEDSPKKEKIRLLGYVDEQDKSYLYAQSKVVCYPSFYEGFGFVPLEAMACGVPVITSARTSMPEASGEAAILVEPYLLNDLVYALEQILSDSALRQYYIDRGFEHAKQFTWQKCSKEITKHLMDLNA
jgi:glycosyltransferase involved in cell wall biosynthesis